MRETFIKERELLHKQLELLAEKSSIGCTADELANLSKQMVAIHRILYSPNF